MLGNVQKSMFKDALLHSKAKFKFVATLVNMQQVYALPYDDWEEYAAERSEILNFIRNNAINNVIFLSTDSHRNVMNEVFIDRFADPKPIAYEFVTGPIAQHKDQQLTLQFFGPNVGPKALQAFHGILDLVGADCRNLNASSYGSVQMDSATGTPAITLKDENGNAIHDQLNSAITCTKTFGTGILSSSSKPSVEFPTLTPY